MPTLSSAGSPASAPSSGEATTDRMGCLLLTGAAGGLGRALRPRLAAFAQRLRLSDRAELDPPCGPGEAFVRCDLADKAAVHQLLTGCDAVVHLGGISVERPFEEVLEANIKGMFHLYEAARRQRVRRIVFASSNHVIGFYRQTERIDAAVPHRPDGYYGLSKSFGENLAQFYFDRWGIETVSIRIGSSFPEPTNRRMLSTWMSYDDLADLIDKALTAPGVGHTVVYGVSANRDVWWDNRNAERLGFTPRDSSERFRSQVQAAPAPAPDDPSVVFQGGAFTAQGPFDD